MEEVWRLPLETILPPLGSTQPNIGVDLPNTLLYVANVADCELNHPYRRSGTPSAFQQNFPTKSTLRREWQCSLLYHAQTASTCVRCIDTIIVHSPPILSIFQPRGNRTVHNPMFRIKSLDKARMEAEAFRARRVDKQPITTITLW